MASILYELDNGLKTMEQYKAISYIGLEETDYYRNNIEDTTEESVIAANQTIALAYRSPCK